MSSGILSINSVTVGFCDTNCFVVADSVSREAFVIDPGDSAEAIEGVVTAERLVVRGIINTHCHADHIIANGRIRESSGSSLLIHEADAAGLVDAQRSLGLMLGLDGPLSPAADGLLHDGDTLRLGELEFEVIHTPGHTPGGICLLCDGHLFSGDTLFMRSIGRTDFPGGDPSLLVESIRGRLFPLPGDTVVHPGHGTRTTIGEEIRLNPYTRLT